MKSKQNKPYDYFAAMEQLRERSDDMSAEELARLKASVALNASDLHAVSLYVDLRGDDMAHIYPPIPARERVSTGKAIDTFLTTYGKSSPEEDALLERLIFNPVPEYGGVLEERDKAESGESTTDPGELAKAINSAPAPTCAEEEKETEIAKSRNESIAPKPTPMTLELAKIFVKQGQFERAHEIISKIILNNPEKSVYFADQLRFLEKLMRIKAARKN